jgi:hypothetical protein
MVCPGTRTVESASNARDARRSCLVPERASNLLLPLRHAQVSFRLMVGKSSNRVNAYFLVFSCGGLSILQFLSNKERRLYQRIAPATFL